MQWKEGKKKLAVLLSAALVLSLIPTSAFTALAEWTGTWEQGKVWLENVSMKTDRSTINVSETATITVAANKVASPSGADPKWGTPSNATEVLKSLTEKDVVVSQEGIVDIEVNEGTIKATGIKDGTVKISLNKIEDSSCYCTIIVKDPDKEAVETASEAIKKTFGSSYPVEQTDAETKEKLESFLKQKAEEALSSETISDGLTVKVTVTEFNAAKNGTEDNPTDIQNGSFKFTVEINKGSHSKMVRDVSGTITAKIFEGTTFEEMVNAAEKAIKDGSYIVDQVDAQDENGNQKEDQLKEKIIGLINALPDVSNNTIRVVTVNVTEFEKAQNGNADEPNDTKNGSFKFTVEINKGSHSKMVSDVPGTITAQKFVGVTNEEAVDDAKSAIEAETYTFTQAMAGTDNALKEVLATKINGLSGVTSAGVEKVTADNITVSYSQPVEEGTADNPKGTDGIFSFTVSLKKGLKSGTATSKGTITATQFIGTTNAEAVATAKSAIEGGTYTVKQEDAGDENALKTVLAAQINALSGMSGTEIEVKAEDITVSGFKAATAGTADNLKGTNGSFTFTVKLSKGKTTEETVSMTGKITAVSFIITGFTFEPGQVRIDLAETLEAEVTVTPQMTGTPTEEQKKAIAQDFRDGKFKAELTFTGQHCAQILKTTVNDEGPTVSLTIEGLANDNATLKVSYGALTASCPVFVTEPEGATIVGAEVPEMNLDEVNEESLVKQLKGNLEEGTEVPADAGEQISAILDTLASSELPFETINQSVEAMLMKEKSDASVIILTPIIKVQELELGVKDEKVVVKSMDAELTVDIEVDGTPLNDEETKTILKNNNIYISMSVAVPERAARGNADYVKWTHYRDAARTTKDNSVLEDEVTGISTDNIATVRARSFSPFTLEFVMNDNESADSSDSDSESSVVLVGEWVRAADGVRWWYRYPDGTWPAGEWAQLVWNGRLDWYYFDEKGYMETGWITDGGLRYYLHPISDGTQGYMYTGWHLIDGKYYYFSDISDGTRGHLLVNTTTPDGAVVGADGARIR